MAASAIWLSLVALVLGACLRIAGPRQFFVDFLGHFSRNKFLELIRLPGGAPGIAFAYRLLGITFYHFIAQLDGLIEVHWSKGQGSYYAQKDVNDWDVAIWFRRDALRGTRSWNLGSDPTEIHLLGLCGQRTKVEPFGLEVVDFLRQAGVEFSAPEDGRKFTVRRAG
jgi:hypothetical protein